MKKIIFVSIPMSQKVEKVSYLFENGKPAAAFDTCFAISAALSSYLKSSDTIKIVMIKKHNTTDTVNKYAQILEDEVRMVNRSIGAELQFRSVDMPFIENRKAFEVLLEKLVAELETDTEIVADITYGPKSMPILLFATLNFAEKFFNCKIQKIIYGKFDFTKTTPPELCDVTSLYYINSITNIMEAESSEKAKHLLSKIIRE